MEKFEKWRKYLKGDMIALFIIQLIMIILNAVLGRFALISVIYCAGFCTTYYLAAQGNIAAGIISLIIAVLHIISFDLISMPLGIFLAIHSICYIIKYNEVH